MKRLLGKYKLEVIGSGMGALAGWIYWHEIGCASGTCAITSSSVNSTLYGALMGGVLLSLFKKKENTEKQKQEK